MLCSSSRNSSCKVGMHKSETMTLPILNVFHFVLVVTLCNPSLPHPPSATPPPPPSLIPTSLIPLTHIYHPVYMFLWNLLRWLPWGLSVCFLLTQADYQAVCQQCVQPGLNKGWFSGRLAVLRHPQGKVIAGWNCLFYNLLRGSLLLSHREGPVRLIKMYSSAVTV